MSDTDADPKGTQFAVSCLMIYMTFYAFEAPIRYGLHFLGAVQLILTRDLLIILPLLNFAYNQIKERWLHPAIWFLGFMVILQGTIFFVNFQNVGTVLIGAKIFFNTTLGLILGRSLLICTAKQARWMLFLWVATAVGLIIEKYFTQFPWVGMSTVIGGIEVPISLDWQNDDPFSRRVGGFTRESICAASIMPILGFILVTRCRKFLWRFLGLATLVGSIFLTTQKGALIGALSVSLCLLLPALLRLAALRLLVIAAAVLQVAVPFLTNGMQMTEGTGAVFTTSSFAIRVLYTWPGALEYIYDRSLGPFGVGLGGLAGPMRLILPVPVWMYGDNMFLLLYANLGVLSFAFYGCVAAAVWYSLRITRELAEPALAILGFCLLYGVVITGFEDQMLSLGIGGALGTLLARRNRLPVGFQPPVVVRRRRHAGALEGAGL